MRAIIERTAYRARLPGPKDDRLLPLWRAQDIRRHPLTKQSCFFPAEATGTERDNRCILRIGFVFFFCRRGDFLKPSGVVEQDRWVCFATRDCFVGGRVGEETGT